MLYRNMLGRLDERREREDVVEGESRDVSRLVESRPTSRKW